MNGQGLQRSPRSWILAGVWSLYLVMWFGGIGSYVLFGGVRAGDEWTAPLFLTLAGVIVLASVPGRRRTVLLLAGILGFLAEWIGLRTGVLFGQYRYTDVLAPSLFGVPLVMISAWLVLIAYVDDLLLSVGAGPALRIVSGAAVLTSIDLIIDPLAAGPLGYWTWATGGAYYGIPTHNFVGWFVVGLVILTLVQLEPARQPSSGSLWTGFSIVLFFTVLALVNTMVVPVCVGAVLCALHIYVRRAAPGS